MTTRRAVLGATLALAACGRQAASQPSQAITGALKGAPFPIGTAVMTGQLQDAGFTDLIRRHVSQLTPEWEMKMEYILQADGSLKFDAPDAIAAFARDNGLKLHGHTLVWYAQGGAMFDRLKDDRTAFGEAYDRYIHDVASRYAGVARSWDVLNEPVTDEGTELRSCLWTQMLGETDHAVRAYEQAALADANAVLFLNDYHLELKPVKRRTFMRLAETLLKRGVKLGGLGTQTHVDIDMAPGAIKAAMADLASLGLPIHLSELDIATHMKRVDLRPMDERLRKQTGVAREAAEAFMSLPPAQRFAFTLWGLRDSDSWLRRDQGSSPQDEPSLFAESGSEKPAFAAVAQTFGV